MLHGGPERWDKDVDFMETVEIFYEEHAHDNGVHMHQISSSYGSLYRVLCQTLGNYTAIQAGRSPGQIHVTPVTVENGQTIRVAAVSISTSAEPFANSSSLCLKWELGNCDSLAYWDYAYDSESSNKSSWARFMVLRNESGSCIVRATVTGLFGSYTADRYSAKLLDSSKNFLTDAARLEANLSITGGSRFLETVVNDSRVVEITQSPPGLQCLQLMLSPKDLGTAVVTVYDIGLARNLAASIMVQVADIDWIKIMFGEEISLYDGKEVHNQLFCWLGLMMEALFTFLRKYARYLAKLSATESWYAYMNIHVHIEDDIVELVDKDDISSLGGGYISAQNFKIRAKHLSITTLYILLATVYGNSDDVICKAYGTIKVGVPSSTILNVQSEQLAVGCETPIYPLFSEASVEVWGPIDWFRGSSALLLCGAPGRTNVAVSFSCDFISSGSHLEARTYSAYISLLVVSDLPLALVAPITWVLPPHYTTSSILPSSTESHGQKDSQSRKGKDRITGRTEIASCVRVAEVEQIRIKNKEFPIHVIDLAVGAEIELPISSRSGVKLQTTVTVLPGSTLVVDAPKEMLTNVPFPSQGISFSVKFSDTNDKINALGSCKGAPYDCRVDPPFVGYAKPWMDLDTGNSFCLFFPYSPEHLARSCWVTPGLDWSRLDRVWLGLIAARSCLAGLDVAGSRIAELRLARLFAVGSSMLPGEGWRSEMVARGGGRRWGGLADGEGEERGGSVGEKEGMRERRRKEEKKQGSSGIISLYSVWKIFV
ncbi:hypothetical protein CRYUN_Cryun24cG0114100 [Craigia yunnanensis]